MVARVPDHEIEPFFVNRWSPRAFAPEEIPEATLMRCFEAARWAPSGFNHQPWRFLYARRDTESWNTFHDLLTASNQVWAAHASALVLIASHRVVDWEGQEIPATSNSFDTGAAWSNLAHQANLLGWHTHAVGGFDRERARSELRVPDAFAIETMVVIGRLGTGEHLPPKLLARERPSTRRPLQELVMEGGFR